MDKVTGSELEDASSVQALSIGREVDLFKSSTLSESCVVEQVLASTVVAFFPFCLYERSKDFIGACRFEGAACQSGLVSMSHTVEPHLSEQIKGGRSGDHDKKMGE